MTLPTSNHEITKSPIFGKTNIENAKPKLSIPLPTRNSEEVELKYVQAILQKQNVPDMFEIFSYILSTTKHSRVHNLIYQFVLKCLQNPLEIAECMKDDKLMTKSHSIEINNSQTLNSSNSRIRQSYTSIHIDDSINSSDQTKLVKENEKNLNDEESDTDAIKDLKENEIQKENADIDDKDKTLNVEESTDSNDNQDDIQKLINADGTDNSENLIRLNESDETGRANSGKLPKTDNDRLINHSSSFTSFFTLQTPPIEEVNPSDFLIGFLESLPGMIPNFHKGETSEIISTIPQVFISLTPDLKILNSVGIPKIEYFKAVSQCSIKIISLFEGKVIDKREIIHFVKMIIMSSFQCSAILSDINRMTHMKKPLYFSYLNEFIPIVAKFLPIITEDNSRCANDDVSVDEGGMTLLLQQFWISLVAQSSGDMSFFSKSYRELRTIILFLPPLLSRTNPIDYHTISGSIQDLLSRLKFELIVKKKDEIQQTINKIAPSISIKSLNAFNTTDLVLLLSIAVLEKMRSLLGIFVPMMEYLEIEIVPKFLTCFDCLINPCFIEFQTYLITIQNIDDYNKALNPVVSYMFEKFVGDFPQILPFIDKVIDQFISSHLLVLVSYETLSSFLNTYMTLKKQNSPRLQSFKELGMKMFLNSINYVPFAFINILVVLILNQSPDSYFVQNNEILSIIFELILNSNKNSLAFQFTNQLSMFSKAKGALPFLTLRKILKIDNVDNRLLILSLAYIDNQGSNQATSALISTFASPDLLMIVWSHIVSTPGYNCSIFMQNLITFFNQTVEKNQGIFNTNGVGEEDLELIGHQATIIRFFNEQMLLLNFSEEIFTIIPPLFSKELSDSAATCVAIYPLISLVSNAYTIMKKKIDIVLQTAMICYTMKLGLISISFRTMPDIFKYISHDEAIYFENDINNVNNILKNSTLIYDLKTVVNMKKKNENADSFTKIGDKAYRIIEIMNDITNGIVDDQLIFQKLGGMIGFLMSSISVLFLTFIEPIEKHANEVSLFNKLIVRPRNFNLNIVLPYFYVVYAPMIPSMCETLNCTEAIITMLPQLIEKYEEENSIKSPLFIAKAGPKFLKNCKIIGPNELCEFLKPEILSNKDCSEYIMKCFEQLDVEHALLFVPQFVQSISNDDHEIVAKAMVELCKRSSVFCHFLLWNITSEKSRLEFNPSKKLLELEQKIFALMSSDHQAFYEKELQFINSISHISKQLLPLTQEERKVKLVELLKKLKFQSGLFIPSNPEFQILEIDANHSYPLKSHSHVPILVRFKSIRNLPKKTLVSSLQLPLPKPLSKSSTAQHVAFSILPTKCSPASPKDGSKLILNLRNIAESTNSFVDRHNPVFISCIFKTDDDVRMESLMSQLIHTLKEIFKQASIDCYLLPYNIHSTGTRRGVIEVIRNANTRHEIGEATKLPLLGYFKAVYGETTSPEFQRALNNFIKSIAPYSLVCYLFQVKDRHNANIMIDDQGHVIHIDFGFIFDISPGGNMKFEKAPFKLNSEMIELLGGSKSAEAFMRFTKLFTQCFLAVRSRYEEIEAIAALMKDADFPCFKQDSFKKLKERFFLDKPDTELQGAIDSLITGSMNAVTTTAYDAFQHSQNSIFYI